MHWELVIRNLQPKKKINLRLNGEKRVEVERMETLKIYKAKKKIEGLYSNYSRPLTLFKCWTNTLNLN